MNNNTVYKKPNNVPVFSPKLCNILLNKGYSMASVSRNKRDNVSTVFYFKPQDGLDDIISAFISEVNKKVDEQQSTSDK